MNLIGITGGIASGKSSVARYMARMAHWPLVDCDAIVARLIEPHHPGWMALKSLLPETFFTEKGILIKRRLRQEIFENITLRERVNEAIHPLVRAEVLRRAASHNAAVPCLVEVPLLFEAGWQEMFARIIVVYANKTVCQRRLVLRDGVNDEEALNALDAQENLFEKAVRADHVIDSSSSWFETVLQVRHLLNTLEKSSRIIDTKKMDKKP